MDPLPLDDQQLELIEAGRCGLRALTVPEEALVETSSRERASRRRISRRRRIAGRVLAAATVVGVGCAGIGAYFLQRPSIACGSLQPHGRASCVGNAVLADAFADQGERTESFPGRFEVDERCVDDAEAIVDGRLSCDSERSIGSAHTRVGLFVEIGGRCGRWGTNRGGAGGVNPVWTSTVDLPHGQWRLTAETNISRALTTSRCALGVDGKTGTDLSVSGTSSVEETVSGGQHTIRVSCSGDRAYRGCLGGPPVWSTSAESYVVEVTAKRL